MKNKLRDAILYLARMTCCCFTVIVILSALINLSGGAETQSIGGLFQLLLQAFLSAVFSLIAFTDALIPRCKLVGRYLLFFAMLLPQVALLGWLLGWFEGSAVNWMLWIPAITIVSFGVITFFVILSEKSREQEYDQKLKAYQQKHAQ